MSILKLSFFCLCLFALTPKVGAQALLQEYSNLHYKRIPVKDTMRIDTCSIGDVSIEGVAPTDYELSPYTAILHWTKKPLQDSVSIRYRRLAFDFNQQQQHKKRSIVDSNYSFSSGIYNKHNNKSSFVSYNQMELNGSYGRAISLGNNQDVVLNSNFNLQVNGYLMDSIKVEAAITDNTVPFQPEGNTATLQEFDQISIRISKNQHSIQLGDYNLNKPDAYFLNYTKRVQGLFFQSEDALGKKASNKSGLSVSVAKGEFARNIFNGTEGNQGPYRLVGNNGEQLFVVLAATEKVYVDNILQERGESADYTINYNTNEVRFMPRRPINQFSRIQIEFEYRSNNYLNSLIYAYDELSLGKKWKLRTNIYSNQDAKNQGFQQNLSSDQKQFLSSIGDSVQDALVQNIVKDTFAANKILYRIKDTSVSSIIYDSVYEYSTEATLDLYAVSFSYAGTGKGNYIVSGSTANGRVYRWLAPIGGQAQGDYSAVSLLITPKKHQVITLAAEYQIDSFKKVMVEWAGSDKNPNTFSSRDNSEHKGFASKMIYEERRFFGKKDSLQSRNWSLQTKVQYEHVQSKFRAIAPFRAVEFGRDWNVPLSGVSPDENWAGISSSLANKHWGMLDYAFSYYSRGNAYQGQRNELAYKINRGKINTGFQMSLMNATDSLVQTQFFRPHVFAEYSFLKGIRSTLGLSYHVEHNEARYRQNDSLQQSSFFFDIATAFWRSLPQHKYNLALTYFRRRDFLPYQNNFELQNHSDNLSLQFSLREGKNHQLQFTGNYRQLHIDHTSVLNAAAEETVLGRIQYNGGILNKTFSFASLYEFGTGQEQKNNFTYVAVPAGQGLYNWVDYNGDGVQQLNEFVVALYPDQKLFIKIFTPSNEYVKVNNLNYNQSINFEPGQLFRQKNRKGLGKLCGRFSDQFSLQLQRKILSTEGIATFNPLRAVYNDTAILLANLALNNTFYFNRSNSHWGLDYNYLSNASTQLLSYGLSTNKNTQHLTKARVVCSRSITCNLTGKTGIRSNLSGVNDGNAYLQRYWSLAPALIWLKRSMLRVTTSFNHEIRRNDIVYGGESAQIQSANLETRYSQTAAGIIQARITFSQIHYDGLNTAPVSYTMLDGLKQGNNLLWYLNWQRHIGKGIELLIEYEGRKSANEKVINTGRMSLRAVL